MLASAPRARARCFATQPGRGGAPTPTRTPGPPPNCVAGTAFGYDPNLPWSPSCGTRWSLVIGPVKPNSGPHRAELVVGAAKFSNGGTGGCSAPGTGGGCGSPMGFVDFTVNSNGINAKWETTNLGAATNAHLYYSCTKPCGDGAPGQYPAITGFSGCGNGGSYNLNSVNSNFPTCTEYYIQFHASIGCDCWKV
ncbi:hypothetical protein DFJ74DRAFT_690649 [Hyaloraphidium curvatum]|nr:hypothetical protein DFJ74DRAFT_690649 [Hyaloraphidium curvatum]